MRRRYSPDAISAATRAMCRELYGDNFDLHDHGSQHPEDRANLERATQAAVEAYLERTHGQTICAACEALDEPGNEECPCACHTESVK